MKVLDLYPGLGARFRLRGRRRKKPRHRDRTEALNHLNEALPDYENLPLSEEKHDRAVKSVTKGNTLNEASK